MPEPESRAGGRGGEEQLAFRPHLGSLRLGQPPHRGVRRRQVRSGRPPAAAAERGEVADECNECRRMQRTPHRGRACRTCGKRPAGYAEALPRRGRTAVSERGVFIKGAAAAPSRHQLLGSREAAEPRAPSAPPASSSGAEPAPTKGPQPAATANHAAETDAPSPAPENRSCGRGDRRAQSPPRRGSMRHPTERRAQSKSRGKSREKSRGKVNRGPKCPSLGCQALRPCRSRRTSERPRALPCKLPLMCPARYRPVLPRPPQRSRRNHPHTPAPGTRRCASASRR